MKSRLIRIAFPLISILSIATVATTVFADENADNVLRENNSIGVQGNYGLMRYERQSDNTGYVSLENQTTSNRYGVVSMIAKKYNYAWIDSASAAGIMSPQYSGYNSISKVNEFTPTPYYIIFSASLYNSTNSASGVLESYGPISTPE